MTPERWQKIRELFHATVDHNADERALYLATACAADPSLRTEVEKLISSHDQAASFLERPQTTLPGAGTGPTLEPGQLVGHYRIVEPIGQGGMGVVYKAEDTKLGRLVALKFLPPTWTEDLQALERFRREARAASALNHPNVCTIYAIEEDEGQPFIAMELLNGQTLAACIASEPLAPTRLIELSVQIANGLQAAHERGITHRDIKPGNIFVTDEGQAKILDFGLARITTAPESPNDGYPSSSLAAADASLSLTKLGRGMGTLPYVSPEQLRGEQPDSRSDLFSFGAVLYEMATGHSPFSGSQETTIDAILNREPPPPRSLNPDVPAELEQIVRRALEKNRELRYQTAANLKADLAMLMRRQPLDTARSNLRRQRASRTLALTGAIVAIGAVALYIYLQHGRAAYSPARVKSLAVLPFTNSGDNPDAEYLSDGITEDLIDSLSQIPELKVIARTTAFRYKGKEHDFQKLKHELSVDAVLTGSVQHRGDALVVHADLINLPGGSQLWGGRFNRKLTDALQVQEEMTKAISENLRPRLTPEAQNRITRRHTENAEAHQLYWRGRYFYSRRSQESLSKAIEYFERAIQLDPKYALAYAWLADAFAVSSRVSTIPSREAYAKAKAAALKALELDSEQAEAHAALGLASFYYDWDWPAAERHFKRAIALEEDGARNHGTYAAALMWLGRFDEALRETQRARELDPVALETNAGAFMQPYYARRYDEAISEARKTLEMDPNFSMAHRYVGQASVEKQLFDEAIAAFRCGIASGGSEINKAELGRAYALSGQRGEAMKILSELKDLSKRKYVASFDMAVVHAGLGQTDQTIEWLQRSYAERESWIVTLKVSPVFDPLRSDPRFVDLIRRVGLWQGSE